MSNTKIRLHPVVNGREEKSTTLYPETTADVVITDENNQFVSASQKAEWTGKQDAISSENKLNADLVDASNTTNKFVTASELSKLNGIAEGAQVNSIESISVNGTTQTIEANKNVNISVPTGALADENTVTDSVINNGAISTSKINGLDSKLSDYDSHVGNTDIHVTTQNKSDWNAKYSKPSGGIPDTDLTSAVQASLGKADSAIQPGDNISDLVNDTGYATEQYVNNAIENLPEPMTFQGSVGIDGTISWADLHNAANTNKGHTYKVITAHTADTKCPTCQEGDTIISNGEAWIVIPSGDEPSGTVTSVGLSADNGSHIEISGSPVTSSGTLTISLENGYSIPSTQDQTAWSNKQNAIDSSHQLGVECISGLGNLATVGTITNSYVDDDAAIEIKKIAGLGTALGNKLEETTKLDSINQLFNRAYTAVNLNEVYIPKSLSDNYTFGGNITFNGSTSGIVASDVSGLAAVAASGSYNDLSNKPTSLAKLNVEQSFTKAQHFNGGASIKAISYSRSYKISETSPAQASLKDVPLELHDLFFSGSRIGGGGILKVFRDQREQGTPPTPEHSWENPAYDESTFHTCWAPAHSPIQRPDASFDKYSNKPWTDWNLVVGNTSSTVEDVKLENPAEPLLNNQHVFTGFDTYSIGYVVSNFSKVILTARWRDSDSGKIEVYSSTFDMQAIAIDVTTSANNNILCVPGPNGEVAKCYIEKDGSGDLHFKWQSGTRASSGVSGWTSVRLAFVN